MSATTVHRRLPRVVRAGIYLGFERYKVTFRHANGLSKDYWAWFDNKDCLQISTFVRKQPVSPNVYTKIADKVMAAILNYIFE